MSAGAVLIIRMRRIVQAFRNAGATHPARAVRPADINVKPSFLFQRLVQRGVLVAIGTERYYLDEKTEAHYRRRRQTVALLLLAVALVLFIVSLKTAHK